MNKETIKEIENGSVQTKNEEIDKATEELIEAGVHLGHRISKLHPKMKGYVVGVKNTVHIIDLEKTKVYLEKALFFISEIFKSGGKLLLVSTKPPLKKLVEETAKECGIPYVVDRWLGGTFTNFKVINKRAKFYQELQKKKEDGEFERFSKKEKIKMERNLNNLKSRFEGIKDLEEAPAAIFICDLVKDKLPFREARIKGIKTVAMVDTNADPTLVDYPIPANDDAITSVKYILDKVKETILKTKNKI